MPALGFSARCGALLAIPPLPGAPARVALIDLAIGDLLLQLNDRVHERIWARWTACHVHVNGQEVVHAGDRAVRALIWSAGGRTHAHRNYVLGIRHLVVNPADGVGHLHRHGARDDHDVGLARRGAVDL